MISLWSRAETKISQSLPPILLSKDLTFPMMMTGIHSEHFFLFTLLFAPGLQHWNLCSSSKITSLWAVKLQAVDQFGKILWCQECNAKKRRGEDFKIWLEQTRLEKQKQLCIQHREQGKSSLLVQQKLPLSTPPGSVWGSPWKGFPGPLKVLTISDCDYITM